MADHRILKITKADLDETGKYVGAADVTNFDGSIEITANLGQIGFEFALRATFSITAEAGSGIKAGSGIEDLWTRPCGARNLDLTINDALARATTVFKAQTAARPVRPTTDFDPGSPGDPWPGETLAQWSARARHGGYNQYPVAL